MLIFFIAGLYLLRLGAYRIPPETGLLIPSGFVNRGHGCRYLGVGVYGEHGCLDATKRDFTCLGEACTRNGHDRSNRPAGWAEALDLRRDPKGYLARQFPAGSCYGHGTRRRTIWNCCCQIVI